MNLDQQLKILIDEAPQYGVASVVMAKAVTPVLKKFAHQLKHQEYYIVQNHQQDWVLTTLRHRKKPQLQKKVIYAFSSQEDALKFQGVSQASIQTLLLPVTHILFQLFSFQQVDSIIFMETGYLNTGKEIINADLQNNIQQKLRRLGKLSLPQPNTIPPNLT